MTDLPEPNGNDPLKQTRNAPESESLVRVPASEQQQPGALGCCPVCGTPYALGAKPVTQRLPESSSLQPVEAAQPTEPSELRMVLRCPQCGTYSVGEPPTT